MLARQQEEEDETVLQNVISLGEQSLLEEPALERWKEKGVPANSQ